MNRLQFCSAAVVLTLLLSGCAPTSLPVQSSDGSVSSPGQTPVPSAELFAKRIEYRDAIREVAEILELKYNEGTLGINPLAEALISLAEAESSAARTQQERQGALEKVVEHAKKLEGIVRAKVTAGVSGSNELSIATASRLKAELLLLESLP